MSHTPPFPTSGGNYRWTGTELVRDDDAADAPTPPKPKTEQPSKPAPKPRAKRKPTKRS